MNAAELVAALDLRPHPEGGWFRETWRAAETIPADALPERFSGPRSHGTAIYFMLARGQRSALHRIASDEVWCFHVGAPLVIETIIEGQRVTQRLGLDLAKGEAPQRVVPHGVWFGAYPDPDAREDYTLVTCTVAPGFDFADFELMSPPPTPGTP